MKPKIKPILLDLPTQITTPRLLLRPPKIGDGVIVNEAVSESFENLREYMPWAKEKPSVEDSEITCDVTNIHSKKIPERLGYDLESVAKASRVKETGEVSDTLIFARTHLEGLPNIVVTW